MKRVIDKENIFKNAEAPDKFRVGEEDTKKRQEAHYDKLKRLRNEPFQTKYRPKEKKNYFTSNQHKGEQFFFTLNPDSMGRDSVRIIREMINGNLPPTDYKEYILSDKFLTAAKNVFYEKMRQAEVEATSIQFYVNSGQCPDIKYYMSVLTTVSTSAFVFGQVCCLLDELTMTRSELVVTKYIPALRQYSKYIY